MTSKKIEHLNSETQSIMHESKAERINYLYKDKWIGYGKAKKILEQMDELQIMPKIDRMPNLLLIGDTNNGKSAILKRFERKYPSYIDDREEQVVRSVICVQAPPLPDEARFYNQILEEARIPHKKHDRVDRKQYMVIEALKRLSVKILVIDEIHHILSGTVNKQRVFLNVLKFLSNEIKLSIIGAGTKEAYFAINADSQLGNRFQPVVLPRWELNEDYIRLLATFECMLPLKEKSNLIQMDIANRILSLSEGTIGEMSAIIKKATKIAIESEEEKITTKILDKIDYTPPSKRKHLLDKVGF